MLRVEIEILLSMTYVHTLNIFLNITYGSDEDELLVAYLQILQAHECKLPLRAVSGTYPRDSRMWLVRETTQKQTWKEFAFAQSAVPYLRFIKQVTSAFFRNVSCTKAGTASGHLATHMVHDSAAVFRLRRSKRFETRRVRKHITGEQRQITWLEAS